MMKSENYRIKLCIWETQIKKLKLKLMSTIQFCLLQIKIRNYNQENIILSFVNCFHYKYLVSKITYEGKICLLITLRDITNQKIM